MGNLSRLLSEWAEKGLITHEQLESIESYEKSKQTTSRPGWILYGFLVLGLSVVGIGVVSLIASNWESIPAAAKLAADFILLMAVAWQVVRFDSQSKTLLAETGLVFLALLSLASIGLVAQVFNTGGEPWEATLFWIVITLPIALASRRAYLPNLWIVGFIGTIALWAGSRSYPLSFLSGSEDNRLIFMVCIPFICLAIGAAISRIIEFERHARIVVFSNGFLIWATVLGTALFVATDILCYDYHSRGTLQGFLPLFLSAPLAIVAVLVSPLFRRIEKLLICLIAVSTAFMYIPAFFVSQSYDHSAFRFIGPAYFILMMLMMAALFIIRDRRKLFNLATFIIGVRFLVVYFQVFGSLAATGAGLIVSGMVITGVSLLWFKKKDVLERWAKGVIG
ncbi:MAG: DUF2157 domain-containing protein [Myxococcota bacterium]|jgi:uncharacterized membrane protein